MVQVERKRKVTLCWPGNLKDFWGMRTVYTTAVEELELQVVMDDVL